MMKIQVQVIKRRCQIIIKIDNTETALISFQIANIVRDFEHFKFHYITLTDLQI